jgi:hypothetical protein
VWDWRSRRSVEEIVSVSWEDITLALEGKRRGVDSVSWGMVQTILEIKVKEIYGS